MTYLLLLLIAVVAGILEGALCWSMQQAERRFREHGAAIRERVRTDIARWDTDG